jgi:hypothetical protein
MRPPAPLSPQPSSTIPTAPNRRFATKVAIRRVCRAPARPLGGARRPLRPVGRLRAGDALLFPVRARAGRTGLDARSARVERTGAAPAQRHGDRGDAGEPHDADGVAAGSSEAGCIDREHDERRCTTPGVRTGTRSEAATGFAPPHDLGVTPSGTGTGSGGTRPPAGRRRRGARLAPSRWCRARRRSAPARLRPGSCPGATPAPRRRRRSRRP